MRGITFDQQNITAEDMAHYMYIVSQKKTGVSKGLTMTYSGSNIYIASGRLLICGRQVAVDGTDTVPAPTVSSGTLYCRLVYEVDLSKTNTAQSFQQGYWKILQSYDSYPTLTQQDLDNNPSTGVYQMPMAKFTVTTSGIGNWVDERQQFDVLLTGTLAAGSTSVVISSPSITTSSMFDIYTETLADGTPVYPLKQLAATGSLTLTFEAQAINIGVKVRVH